MDPSDTIYILPQDGNAYEGSVFHKDAAKGEKGKAVSGQRNIQKKFDERVIPDGCGKRFVGILFLRIEKNEVSTGCPHHYCSTVAYNFIKKE